ncbi:hypothetical protein RE428_11200 [Marinobacter nanhaiticus D15-8W]|nr:hypothetical protein RE428_11200 [Marinobacter nanhaiticus D15-8W]
MGHIDEMDVREGGGYHMSFTNFTTGNKHSFSARFTELKPGELIRHIDRFDDANLPGEIQVTIRLQPVLCGTDPSIVQEGIPEVIPEALCYQGWQESLGLLALLVDPEIPDEM